MKSLIPLLLLVAISVEAAQLTDGSGQAILLCGAGDPEGFLYRGVRQPDGSRSGGNQTAIIDAMAAGGGNVLYMITHRVPPGDGTAEETPMTCSEDGSTACEADWDCTGSCELDADILNQWEIWFSSMEAAGIYAYFFFLDDGACPDGFDCNDGVAEPFEQKYYGGLVNAFEHHSNIIWVWTEEFTDLGGGGGPAAAAAEAIAVAAYVAGVDDGGAPFGVHTTPGTDFETYFTTETDIDFWSMQYNGSDLYPLNDWHLDIKSRYVVGDTATSPYALHVGEVASGGMETGEPLRDQLWHGLMAGSSVLVHGWWNDQNCLGNACYPDGPPATDLNYCRELLTLTDSVNLAGADPDNTRVAGSSSYALVDDTGLTYLAYATSYSTSMGITNVPAEEYALRWLDENGNTAEEAIDHDGGDLMRAAPAVISGSKVSLALESIEVTYVSDSTDCNDTTAGVNPAAPEIPDNGIDEDCSGADAVTCYPDVDGDGYGAGSGTVKPALPCDPGTLADATDCDDADSTSHPGAPEVCDGNDNDCDTVVPAVEIDSDGDFYVFCAGWSDSQGDDPAIIDGDDCDLTDGASFPGAAPNDNVSACMRDADDDDYGDDDPPGGVTPGTDCDDTDGAVFPGAGC